MSKAIKVPSFCVDHTTLKAGLYLRETRHIGLGRVKIWDLRFIAPSEKRYMAGQTLHTIEHLFAYKLREYLGGSYISFSPYGCGTGFCFITKGCVSENKLRNALVEAIEDVVPVVTKDEIPSLTEQECGRPDYYALKPVNDWLWSFRAVLANEEED